MAAVKLSKTRDAALEEVAVGAAGHPRAAPAMGPESSDDDVEVGLFHVNAYFVSQSGFRRAHGPGRAAQNMRIWCRTLVQLHVQAR